MHLGMLIGGVIVVCVGILFVIFHNPLDRVLTRLLRFQYGEKISPIDKPAPWTFVVVGVGAIALGLWLVFRSFTWT